MTSASWTYGYDPAGNRTAQAWAGTTGMGTGPGTISYVCDNANRISSTSVDTTTWSFDAAANQLRNGITGVTATYNDRGATTTIGSLAYTAFGAGNQTQLSRGTTDYTSTVLGLSRESIAGSTRDFTRTGAGDVVSTQQPSNVDVYYVKDSLDSVIGLFDDAGAWAGGYSYSPYGERRNSVTGGSIADTDSLRYISGYADRSAGGIYEFGARYYDPSLGRFTSYDPSGQEQNPMAYAGCNPVNAKDPTGLISCGGGLIAATGGAVVGLAFAAGTGGLALAYSVPFVLFGFVSAIDSCGETYGSGQEIF